MSKYKWVAVGDYGVEFAANTKKEVDQWIADEVAGDGNSFEPMPKDYYDCVKMTLKEFSNLKEV